MNPEKHKELIVFRRNEEVALFHPLSLELQFMTIKEYGRLWDRVSQLFDAAPALVPPDPKVTVFMVMVTSICNLACSYCSYFKNSTSNPNGVQVMDMLTAHKVLEMYRDKVGEGVFIVTGGEPITNWEVTDYLFSQAKGIKVLFTNGTLIDDRKAHRLSELGVNVLISLDGDRTANDMMRRDVRGRSTFDTVIESYWRMRKAGCVIGVSMVAGRHNVAEIDRMVKNIIEELQPDSLGLDLPHYTSDYDNSLNVETFAQKMRNIFHIAKETRTYVDQLGRRIKPLVYREFRFRDCSACGEKIVVFPDLTITNCYNLGRKKGNRLDAWKNRYPLNLPACRDCYAIGICGGGCVRDGIKLFPKEGGIDRRNCIVVKGLLEEIIWDIRDSTGEDRPDKETLEKVYEPIIKRKSALNMSIGHENMRLGL
ncbi:hypothetical protein SY88_06510 [Clostridiales bacterium PH28_bin88]|nr:hypothetical protein SY88_06510 [Clostridiales bacterium PH28_bin88]